MPEFANPALAPFTAQIAPELAFGQLCIRKTGALFELRHIADSQSPAEGLRLIGLPSLRETAQFRADGAYRPLKSAPNLRTGWRVVLQDPAELETALNHLYPGALADWFSFVSGTARITNYRPFVERQTGMYRITALLKDEQAADAILAGCHKSQCLKRRLWTVDGLEPDDAADKSVIPCLEPCPLLLEFARTSSRFEQDPTALALSRADLETLVAAVENALTQPKDAVREADFADPGNPRRLRRLLQKIGRMLGGAPAQDG